MKALLLAGLIMLGSAPAVAAQNALGAMKAPSPTLSQLRTACQIGSAQQPAGMNTSSFEWGDMTPSSVTGATTVSAPEAKCVIDRFPGAVLIADAVGDSSIGDALGFQWVGGPTANEQQTANLRRVLDTVSGGRADMPIVVYCHHVRCAYSYYVAQRMVAVGYTSVLWMRGGTEEWNAAGYALESRPNRWTGALNAAVQAHSMCFGRQPLPPGVSDAKIATDIMMRSCAAEDRNLRASLEDYDRMIGLNDSANAMSLLLKSYEKIPLVRIESERKLAEHGERIALAQKERAERQDQFLYLQGRYGQPTIEVYQFCQIDAYKKTGTLGKSTQYYSSIFPHRISKLNEENIEQFEKLSNEFGFDNGKMFIEHVKQIATADRFTVSCKSSATKEDARSRWDLNHRLMIYKNDEKIDLLWTPSGR